MCICLDIVQCCTCMNIIIKCPFAQRLWYSIQDQALCILWKVFLNNKVHITTHYDTLWFWIICSLVRFRIHPFVLFYRKSLDNLSKFGMRSFLFQIHQSSFTILFGRVGIHLSLFRIHLSLFRIHPFLFMI